MQLLDLIKKMINPYFWVTNNAVDTQLMIYAPKLDLGDFKWIANINIEDEEIQLQLLEKIKKSNLSVRKVERLVSEINQGTSKDIRKKTNQTKKKTEFYTPHLRDVEDKLRTIFGTKVVCKQRSDGSGEIVLEYYSSAELERLLELFEVIDKSYN